MKMVKMKCLYMMDERIVCKLRWNYCVNPTAVARSPSKRGERAKYCTLNYPERQGDASLHCCPSMPCASRLLLRRISSDIRSLSVCLFFTRGNVSENRITLTNSIDRSLFSLMSKKLKSTRRSQSHAPRHLLIVTPLSALSSRSKRFAILAIFYRALPNVCLTLPLPTNTFLGASVPQCRQR